MNAANVLERFGALATFPGRADGEVIVAVVVEVA